MKQPTQTAPVVRPDSFHSNISFDEWNSGLMVLPIDDPGRFQPVLIPGMIGCQILSPWSRTDCI
jgi:hypothetical protein